MAKLEIERVATSFGAARAVDEVSLALERLDDAREPTQAPVRD